MAKSYIAGIVIRMGAEAEQLGNAIDDATKSATKLQRELQVVERALKLDPKNTDLAKQKFDILSESVEDTKNKLESLKKAQEQAKAAFERGDISAAEYRAVTREITFTESKLKDLEKELKAAGSRWGDFADKAESVSKKLKSAGEKMGTVGNKMSRTITLPLVGLGVAAAKSAADMEALDAQFEQTFGTEANRAQRILEELGEEFGMLPNRMKPSLTAMTAFGKTAGMDTAEALDMSARAIRVASDSAAYYDRSLEDVTGSLQSFLKGNYANDAALGIAATATTRNTKANELYGKSFNDLNEAQKQLTLLAMVEEGNMLSGAVGQAARESDQLVNQLGNMKQGAMEAAAQLGENFLPIVIDGMKVITEWVGKFSELDEGTQDLIIKLGLIAAVTGPVLSTVGKITSGVGNVVGAFGKLSGAIADKGGLLSVLGAGKGGLVGLLTGPAGLIAGLGLAVTAAVLFSDKIPNLSGRIQKLGNEFRDSSKETEENVKNTKAMGIEAMALVNKIDRLNQIEKLSTEQKEELAAAVTLLNELYPDLNLEIDKHTGKTKESTKAVKQHIAELMKQSLVDIYSKEYAENVARQKDAVDALTEAQEKLNRAQDNAGQIGAAGEAAGAELLSAQVNVASAQRLVDDIKRQQTDLADSIANASNEAAEALGLTSEAHKDAADSAEKSGERRVDAAQASQKDIQKAYRDHLKDLQDSDRQLKIEEGKRITAMREHAKKREEIARGIRDDATQYQRDIESKAKDHNTNMFNIEKEGLRSSELSADQAKANLQKQVQDYDKWRDDLRILAGRVSPEMLAELERLGPGYGKMVEDLLTYSANELREFEDLHLQTGRRSREAVINELKKTPAQVRAEAHNSVEALRKEKAAMREAGYTVGKAAKEGVKSGASGTSSIGVALIDGIKDGLNARAQSLYHRASAIMTTTINNMKKVPMISSPSKVTTRIGEQLAEGLIVGMDNMAEDTSRAAAELSKSALVGMQGLEWMSNPGEFNIPDTALSQKQIYVTGNQFTVREEADIARIASELDRLVRRQERSMT